MVRDDTIMLAGEYALDLLEGEDLRHAQDLVVRDPEFSSEVDQWQEAFTVLLDADPVAPPARVLRSVQAQIFGRTKRSWRDFIPEPENRPAFIAVAAAKAILIALIVWFLATS